MRSGSPGTFGARLKAFREAAGFTQEELATIAGLSVHAISALERGERRRPHMETVRAISAALDLNGAARDALMESARARVTPVANGDLTDAPLPIPPTTLVGRENDLRTLHKWLEDSAVRLITLTGTGGAGKTRLALELARRLASDGRTRVVFVPLAAVRDAELVAPAIAEAFGLSDVSASDLTRCVRPACEDQPTRIVLDNFEQVLDAAILVADLVAGIPSIQVLVTSRAALRVRGEREFPVGPLDLEVDETLAPLADLARTPAVRLFLERVRDVEPGFRLTSGNSATVTSICRRLDALPLALELAAPWMKVLSPKELLRRLCDNALPAPVGVRDLPERQQTMNATVAWSYQLLSPAEQRLFRRLGVLPGKFSVDAAAAVLAGDVEAALAHDDVLQTAATLIDKSLLLRTESSVPSCPLYEMLETVRAFAVLEASVHGERESALTGLARYCAGQARASAEGLVGHAQAEWLDRVRDDLENYRTAFGWLIERGCVVEATEIAFNLLFFWVIRGHAWQGLDWYERALATGPLRPSAEAMARLGVGAMCYTLGEIARARAALARGLAIPEPADLRIRSWTQLLAGHVEHAAGNERGAYELFTRSLEGFRKVGFAWGIGNALEGLAWVALATGELDAAEQALDEARLALRECGPWSLLLMLYVQSVVAVRRKKPDAAIAHSRESLLHIRDLDDKFAFVYAVAPLVAAAVLKGEDVWAARLLGARDAVTERTGATAVDRSVLDLKDEAERTVRDRLGEDRWARAYASGRRASIQSLIGDLVSRTTPT
jgi:predicted ATPase/DNA-binding XRE family transcriptional regulator